MRRHDLPKKVQRGVQRLWIRETCAPWPLPLSTMVLDRCFDIVSRHDGDKELRLTSRTVMWMLAQRTWAISSSVEPVAAGAGEQCVVGDW